MPNFRFKAQHYQNLERGEAQCAYPRGNTRPKKPGAARVKEALEEKRDIELRLEGSP